MTPSTTDQPDHGDAPAVALGELTMTQLRGYRMALLAEEDRVSYWRRLLQARIDLHTANQDTGGPITFEDIARALRGTAAGAPRRVLNRIASEAPVLELPALDAFWSDAEEDGPGWADAEDRLSDYRRALHVRLDEATAELISRYQRTPAAALALLPEVERDQ